ncbi:MAG TPA: DUF4397 domain-containing protein [Abditibacteriaceae bacterium]
MSISLLSAVRAVVVGVVLFAAPFARAQDAPTPAPSKPKKEKTAKPAGPAIPRTASLRVLHAVPGAGAVDVYVDGAKVLADTAVNYKTLTPYLVVPSGSRDLKITVAGSTDALATAKITLKRGGFYTAYAFKSGDKVALDSLNESSGAALKAGQTRIYAIHLSPGAPAVEITTPSTRAKDGTASLLKKLEFNTPRNKTVNAGSATLQIRNGATLLKEATVAGEAGRRYAVFALGTVGATDATAFDVLTVPAGPTAPAELQPLPTPVAVPAAAPAP